MSVAAGGGGSAAADIQQQQVPPQRCLQQQHYKQQEQSRAAALLETAAAAVFRCRWGRQLAALSWKNGASRTIALRKATAAAAQGNCCCCCCLPPTQLLLNSCLLHSGLVAWRSRRATILRLGAPLLFMVLALLVNAALDANAGLRQRLAAVAVAGACDLWAVANNKRVCRHVRARTHAPADGTCARVRTRGVYISCNAFKMRFICCLSLQIHHSATSNSVIRPCSQCCPDNSPLATAPKAAHLINDSLLPNILAPTCARMPLCVHVSVCLFGLHSTRAATRHPSLRK